MATKFIIDHLPIFFAARKVKRDFRSDLVIFDFVLSDDLDATNSWRVYVTVTAGADLYKRVTVDGKDPLDENESVVESDSGMKWLKTTNDDYHIYYGTCLDEYLNGYHVAEIKILPNGNLEKGQEPDKELFEKIEKTIINSFKYNNKYQRAI